MSALSKFTIYNLQFTIKLFLILLAFIFTFYILHFTLLKPASAQSPSTSSSLPTTTYQLPTTIPPTSPIYTDLLVNNLFHSFSCLAVGSSIIGQPCLTYQLQKDALGAIKSVPVLSQTNLSGGALGATTSLIGMLYLNPPVRTADYLASLGEQFGIVKEARAQVVGSGAAVLSPIIKLWQVSRNISYVIMIIIFVIIGLMVMFRQRINPQTVITAQAALPGLVIGLILITFSYFLASLITDVSFLGVNVVGSYFSAAQPGSAPKLVQDIATENVGSIFSKFVGAITSGDIGSIIGTLMDKLDGGVSFWIRTFAGILGFQVGTSLGGPIGSLGGGTICAVAPNAVIPGLGIALSIIAPFCTTIGALIGSAAIGAIVGGWAFANPGGTFGLVLYFIAIAVLIYTMFKLLLRLINNYLTIIFLTISAPFQFLAASLPGRQGLVTNWVLNMLCNVLAFPAVFAIFYFVAYLLGPDSASGKFFGITEQLNTAGNQTVPLFGDFNLIFIKWLLGFGALLATPAIPDIICRAIGRMSQAGQLIGQEISAGTGGGQRYFGQAQGSIGRVAGTFQQAGTTWYGQAPMGKSVAGEITGAGVRLPKIFRPRW